MITSVLFDLDGTLCDCTELHYISLNKTLLSISNCIIERDEHDKIFNGLPTNTKLDMLIASNRVKEEDKKNIWEMKQKYTKKIISEVIKPDPEKIQLHQYLISKKIKIACVTNSIFETASLMLHTSQQLEYIDLLITNDRIKFPKPHPEGYIRAMIGFNSLPERTLIVEDSPIGLQAAMATGANVWAIEGCHQVNITNIQKYLELND